MLIYMFAEHYPNPYKPQFDSEFAFLIRQKHELRIFVGGSFTSTLHPRVKQYGLDKLTALFPTTLRTLPRHFLHICGRLLFSPLVSANRIRRLFDSRLTLKKNLLRISRAIILPARCPDLCYIHNIATASSIDFLHLIFPDSRLVMYFHGGEVGGVSRVTRDRELFAPMQVVFSNTQFSRDQAVLRGCDPLRAMVLPVGFDLPDYPDSPDKAYFRGGLCRLISIGRLSEEKGLIHALDAVALLVARNITNIRYTIVGRGIQDDFLKDYVHTKGLSGYVEFAGEKDKTEVVRLLGESDILVLPSLVTATWAETQGAVVQEAMFMRALVVTTSAGGVPECIPEVMRQYSVPPGDSSAMADAIENILALPAVKMSGIASVARDFAASQFDIEVTGRKLLEVVSQQPVIGAHASTQHEKMSCTD